MAFDYRQVIPTPKQQKPFLDPIFARAEAIRQEIDRRECAKSCRKFIKRHVKIEDRDASGKPTGIVLAFLLWLGQLKALWAFLHRRLSVVLKARQLGLTWLALAYAVWRMLFNPGYSVVAVSVNELKAKELVRRLEFILRHLPAHLVRPKKGCDPRFTGPTWDSTALTVTIYHRKDEDSTFQGLPASANAGVSFTANLVILDEWAEQEFAEEIWTSIYPIVNRPTGGQVLGLSTMIIGTLFDRICKGAEEGTNGFYLVFLDRWTDPRRDQAWFEATKCALPNTWRSQYPLNPTEARSVGVGAFFEEWSEEVHVPVDHWVPPRSAAWPIIGVYDPAYNQACFCWYTVSPGAPGFPRGWARKFREYAPVHITAYDQAREILRLSCYRDEKKTTIKDPYPEPGHETIEVPGTPYVFRYIVGDSRAWSHGDDSGVSTEEVFRKYGLFMRQADKDPENGWMELHEWLKHRPDLDAPPGPDGKTRLTAKLTFTQDCGVSRRTYPACEQDKSRPYDISDKTPHDAQDCDQYFVQSRVKAVDIKPDPLDELRAKYPEWSPEYQIASREIMREDPKREVSLEDLGM